VLTDRSSTSRRCSPAVAASMDWWCRQSGPRRRTRRGVWVSDGDGEGETRMGEATHGAGEEDAHGGGQRTARAAMGEAATDGIEILFFINGGRGIGGRGGADGRKPNDEGRKTNC